jgi:hypothetical protein
MGRTCSTHGTHEKSIQQISTDSEKEQLRDLGINEKKTLVWILNLNRREDVDSIQLAQDTVQWWILVNTVRNLRVP